jgi:pSer/pThr/pTyr-binding forkhead associated (FHA) protein
MANVSVIRLPLSSRSRHSVRVAAPGSIAKTGVLASRSSFGYAPKRPIPWVAVAIGGIFLTGAASLWMGRMRAVGRLVVTRGAAQQAVVVTRKGITIGGAVGNQLVFDDPRVSRNHAVIQVKGPSIKLVDLKSSNGTKVNGARISSRSLQDGDRILLAEAVELVYQSRVRGVAMGKPKVQQPRAQTVYDDDDAED